MKRSIKKKVIIKTVFPYHDEMHYNQNYKINSNNGNNVIHSLKLFKFIVPLLKLITITDNVILKKII